MVQNMEQDELAKKEGSTQTCSHIYGYFGKYCFFSALLSLKKERLSGRKRKIPGGPRFKDPSESAETELEYLAGVRRGSD